jgi:lysophospholipase L1-like esterase
MVNRSPARQNRVRVVCLGDSLTEASDVPPGQAWHALAAQRLPVEFLNRGVAGDTTAGLLSRFHPEVIAVRPQAVVLLAGANDLWWGVHLSVVQANLFAMVCQARAHGILPLLGLPPPIDLGRATAREMLQPFDGWETLCRNLDQLAHALTSSAAACGVAVLDFHRLFLDGTRTVRTELYLENGLHPNPEGHRLMADTLADVMRRLAPLQADAIPVTGPATQ